MLLMPTKTRISFKNRHFLTLKPALLADKTVLFIIKNRRLLKEKAWNKAVFCSCRFSKPWGYAMWI